MLDDRTYHRILALLRSELQKFQALVAPRRILRLRLYTYYAVLKDIPELWVQTHNAIRRALRDGSLVEPFDGWLACAEDVTRHQAEVQAAYLRRAPIFKRFDEAAQKYGRWYEGLVRAGFKTAGVTTTAKPVTYEFEGESLEVDVQSTRVPLYMCELKNKLSEVYINPDVLNLKLPTAGTHDARKIDRLFRFAHAEHAVPILFAPLVDRSFHSFAYKYGGLFCRTLKQFFPAIEAPLVTEIHDEFRYSNIEATDALPDHLVQWIRDVPQRLKKRSSP